MRFIPPAARWLLMGPRRQLALALALAALLPAGLKGQEARPASRDAGDFASKKLPPGKGFRVFLVADMEGMASAVDTHEVIAGVEGERYRSLTSSDYWDRFRSLLTKEVNAAIAGAREGGAGSFVVNEGHGGNLFANVLPWELDPDAILVRGWPKPIVMITGLDESFGTLMFTGAHANAGSPGVMAHNFAFDDFTVNGKKLNEVGINALIAGEMGVSVSLVSGDDVLVAETREMLGSGFIGVVVKKAIGRNAAITWSPARVRSLIEEAAKDAVRRERKGEFAPFLMEKPYQVAFTLRATYPPEYAEGVAGLEGFGLERKSDRSFVLTTTDAKLIGHLLDAVEEVVLK
ncbi:MAG: M55 family metallopeptidase [Gemmatimonadetes bacterium]|nr:M55 family metallopeptidase [Gemmatimonadota bacterium]